MYKVHRFVGGFKQNHLATYPTLREAYAHAQRLATQERNPSVEYRIFGLVPESARTNGGKGAFRAWLVLDNALQSKGMRRASDILRQRGERPPPTIPSARTFRVDREMLGVRQTVGDGFATHAEARAYIAREKALLRDINATYIVVAPPDKPSRTNPEQPPVGVRSRYLRGAPRIRGYVASAKRERKTHDWEVEDRMSDAALVERSDEELGIGIPAQTNKGRRSRRGQYIP
jgi:hypothetical protein